MRIQGLAPYVVGLLMAGLGSWAVNAQEQSQIPGNLLTGIKWRLVGIQSMDDATGTVRPANPADYTLQLNRDSSFQMQLNCNRANGTWITVPTEGGASGRFNFGKLAMTRALCPPPSLDEQVAAQTEFVRSYLLKDGKLYLSLEADGGIIVWEPDSISVSPSDSPGAPEGGGPRNWEVTGVSRAVNLREQPSTGSKVIAMLAPGRILDNLGCLRVGDRVWCDVQPLGGGPRGYISLEYLKPAKSPDGSVATGPDDSAERAGRGQFDATGQIPCKLFAGQPTSQCEFSVARAGGGYATVVITRPYGGKRMIFFRMGIAIGSDASEADGYAAFRATREGDLTVVTIGEERYEVPDAVIFGC